MINLRGRKIINNLKRPINNKKASSLYKFILIWASSIIIVYFLVYSYAAIMHEQVAMQMNMLANGLVDVISENKSITSGEHQYYCAEVDKYKFYMGSYKVVYKVYDYDKTTDSIVKTDTYEIKGDSTVAAPITLKSNQTIRVEIISAPDTLLQRVSKYLGGVDGDVYCIGFAEGGVD